MHRQIEQPSTDVYGTFSPCPQKTEYTPKERKKWIAAFGPKAPTKEYQCIGKPPRVLYSHQLEAVRTMQLKETNREISIANGAYAIETNVGILAHPVGFGKTGICAAHLAVEKERENRVLNEADIVDDPLLNWSREWANDELPYSRSLVDYASQYARVLRRRTRRYRLNCTLIIAGLSLVKQWQHELGFAPNLTVTIIKTRKQARSVDPRCWDVIIITPTMYNLFVNQVGCLGLDVHDRSGWTQGAQTYAWKRLIYDEPPSTNVPSMVSIECGFVWLISATPRLIQNAYTSSSSTHMIRSMAFNYLDRIFFNELLVKCSDDITMADLTALPPVTELEHVCHQPLARMMRNSGISERVQQLIQADDIAGAVAEMGGDVMNTEYANILDFRKAVIEKEIAEYESKIAIAERPPRRAGAEASIARYREEIRKRNAWITNLTEEAEVQATTMCGICFEDIDNVGDAIVVECCAKIFCSTCLLSWTSQNNTCPACRKEAPKQVMQSSEEKKKEKIVRPPTKVEKIRELLTENQDGKFIICSMEDATADGILRDCAANDITIKEVKGASDTRARIISQFKTGDIRGIFLNANNNGAGINLQECTDIVFYHKMHPDVRTQVIGRAMRIGRKEPLTVHTLTSH